MPSVAEKLKKDKKEKLYLHFSKQSVLYADKGSQFSFPCLSSHIGRRLPRPINAPVYSVFQVSLNSRLKGKKRKKKGKKIKNKKANEATMGAESRMVQRCASITAEEEFTT